MRLVPAGAQAIDPGSHRGGAAGRAVTEVDPQHARPRYRADVACWYPGRPGRGSPLDPWPVWAVTPRLGSMAIARIGIRASGRDRTIRWLTAALVATSLLAIAVAPALAVDPSPSPSPDRRHPSPTLARTDGHPHPVAEAIVAHDHHHPGQQREAVRAGLRPRRRHEPVRRQGPRAGRPDRGADPGGVLQGRDACPPPAPRGWSAFACSAGFAAPSTAPLVLVGRGGTWGFTGTETVFPADAQLRAWRDDDDDRRRDHHDLAGQGAGAGRDDGPPLGRRDAARPPCGPSRRRPPSRSPRGRRSTTRTAAASCSCSARARVSVVNHVELDQYLRGVVPAEMPTSWPREALRAQVIAARSYAVRELNPGTGTYDMVDDTRSQIYRGIKGERSDHRRADRRGARRRHPGRQHDRQGLLLLHGRRGDREQRVRLRVLQGDARHVEGVVPARHHGPLAGRGPVRPRRPATTTGRPRACRGPPSRPCSPGTRGPTSAA